MSREQRSVLLCGSTPYLVETFSQLVLDDGWVPRKVKTPADLSARLDAVPAGRAIVVLDLSVSDFTAESVIASLAARPSRPPLVAVAGPSVQPAERSALRSRGVDWIFEATSPDHEIRFALKKLLESPPRERRRDPRAPAALTVAFAAAGNAPRHGKVKDLTESGLFIETDEPYMLGDLVTLRFDLPDDGTTIEAQAEVVFRSPKQARASALLPGNGVKFRDLPPAAAEALHAFSARTLKRMPGSPEDRSLLGVRK